MLDRLDPRDDPPSPTARPHGTFGICVSKPRKNRLTTLSALHAFTIGEAEWRDKNAAPRLLLDILNPGAAI